MRLRSLLAPLALALLSCGPSAEPVTPLPPPAAASAAIAAPPADRVARHTIVILTRQSGSDVTTITADGTRKTSLQILQNGRGPATEATMTFAPDGTLASFDATGHDTLGIPVDEHFRREGKHVTWKSKAEAGEKDVEGPAFYVPLASLADLAALLVPALQKAGGTLALLPEGEAHVERTGDATVTSKSGATKHITGYAITGLDFLPTRVWLDDDGAFFGSLDEWFSCVPEGFETAIDPIIEIQRGLDKARETAIAAKAAHKPPPAGIAFTHARLFDATARKARTDRTVVVVGDRITAVGPTRTTKVPAGAEVVDATGKTIVPGLWDMHAHLAPGDGVLDIASGVTTVRDLGNDPDRLDAFKKQFDDGTVVGPHVVRAGFMEGRGEKAAGARITAETPDEARAGVKFFADRGYDQIKIYNSMKPELVPIIAAAAHEKGMRVSGHVPVHMRAEDAVRAGYDEINHINMLFLNFFIDKDTDTRTPLRFSIVGEKASGLDLESKPVKDFLALLIARRTTVDPTLGVFENLFLARPGTMSPGMVPVAARIPVQVRRNFLTGGLPIPEGKDQLYRDAFTATLRMVKNLRDRGIPIVAGTDSIQGLMLHRELELYVMAGLSPAEVLQVASLGSARVMHMEKKTGSIDVGKTADLAIVDGDPTTHIEDIRKVATVVRGGVVYRSAELYATMGVRPAR